MKLLMVSIFAALAAPASAEPVALWQTLDAGMTREQVAVAFPHGDVRLTRDCRAKVIARYNGDHLQSVLIRFGNLVDRANTVWEQSYDCQKMIHGSLIQRYGKAVGVAFNPATPGFGTLRWTTATTTIEYFAAENKPFTVIAFHYGPIKAGDDDAALLDGELPSLFSIQ